MQKTWYKRCVAPQELSQASIGDLRSLGLGFRDKRVYTTTKMIVGNTVNLNLLRNSNDSNYIRETLLKLDGVGEKVADCIMLFSLKRLIFIFCLIHFIISIYYFKY